METDVLIVGAGPTGLMLAGELGLAGVRALVVERDGRPSDLPKANGLVGHIVRVFAARGLLDDQPDLLPLSPPRFPFGPLSLELAGLRLNPLHVLPVPQRRLEAMLESRALALGAILRRGHEVTDIQETSELVVATITGPSGDDLVTARYLIGCDGAHSFVREHSGIEFPGITSNEISRMARVTLAASAVTAVGDGVLINKELTLKTFRPNRTSTGAITLAPLAMLDPSADADTFILSTAERRASDERGRGLTLDDLRRSVHRVLGADLPIQKADWVRSTVANSRQASAYRVGRRFLVGDAAHVFSAGGSALNVGLLDAFNLGWKLAADVRGQATDGLLDTYQAERRPAGQRAIRQTRAQAALSSAGENMGALRELLTDTLRNPATVLQLAECLEGNDSHPSPAGPTKASPLVGGWAADVLTGKGIGAALATAMVSGRAILVDVTGDSMLTQAAKAWSGRVDLINGTRFGVGGGGTGGGMLTRPDGYVGWTAEDASEESVSGLIDALRRWFGPA